MLEVRRPIANFHLLVLGVLSNTTPGSIHRSSSVTLTLSDKSLKLNPKQKRFVFLVAMLMLAPTKTDLSINDQSPPVVSK